MKTMPISRLVMPTRMMRMIILSFPSFATNHPGVLWGPGRNQDDFRMICDDFRVILDDFRTILNDFRMILHDFRMMFDDLIIIIL